MGPGQMVDGAVKPNLQNIFHNFLNGDVDLSTQLYHADAEEEKGKAGDNGQEVPVEDNQPEDAEDDEYVQVDNSSQQART